MKVLNYATRSILLSLVITTITVGPASAYHRYNHVGYNNVGPHNVGYNHRGYRHAGYYPGSYRRGYGYNYGLVGSTVGAAANGTCWLSSGLLGACN